MSRPADASLSAMILDPVCEEELCRLIRDRTGIVIHAHQREKLSETLLRACIDFGFSSCHRFVEFLRDNPGVTPEQEFLLAEITVGETYFFRDPLQIEFLRGQWLPRVVAYKRERGERSLRIWSAGCSSGQELYTIAILLRENLPDWRDWNLHLLGTDINSRMLANAVRGRYGRWSFRATPEAILNRHFTREGQMFAVEPALREMAKFCYLNLRDDSFPSILTETHALDLILCRNVFIYFDAEAVRRVMEKFAAALVPGGVLQLAATDPLLPVPGLSVHQWGDIFYLVRATPAPAGVEPAAPPPPRPVPDKPLRPAPEPPARRPEPVPDVQRLVAAQRWDEALRAVARQLEERGAEVGLLLLNGRCLANLGRLAEAAAACDACLALDPTHVPALLLKGMVLQELDRPHEAEGALRRATYLDPRCAEAHYQLGLVKLRGGQLQDGVKRMRLALELLAGADPEGEVLHAEGMTRRRLADILTSELAIYSEQA